MSELSNILRNANTVKEFAELANKRFDGKPFTSYRAGYSMGASVKWGEYYTDWYGQKHQRGPSFTDSKGNTLAVSTILSYLAVDHEEVSVNKEHYELGGVRISETQYREFPRYVKDMCSKVVDKVGGKVYRRWYKPELSADMLARLDRAKSRNEALLREYEAAIANARTLGLID